MKQFFWRYLHFSKLERLSTTLLLAFGLSAGLVPWLIYRHYHPTPTAPTTVEGPDESPATAAPLPDQAHGNSSTLFYFNPNSATLSDWLALGISERTTRSILNYRNKGGQFRRAEDLQKIYTLSEEDFQRLAPYIRLDDTAPAKNFDDRKTEEPTAGELFPFDPNTVSEAELQRLGVPQRAVRGWLNYRNKGGKFRNREDVQKLYALSEDDYLRLAPYIQLAVNQTLAMAPAAYASGGGRTFNHTSRPVRSIDVNRASHEEWTQLPGIGEAWAGRIERFREHLGGFSSVQQVAETKGLPDSVFQKIRPYLQVATPELRRLNLNTATFEELNLHPYVSNFQAKMIVSYRERNGGFRSVDELLKIPEAKVAWVEQMRPYVEVR